MKLRLLVIFVLSLVGPATYADGFLSRMETLRIQDTVTYNSAFAEENEHCFKCHGQSNYEYMNENLGRFVKAPMFSERVVKRNEFYESNHGSFSCTDCHSAEYTEFPHKGELRMESKFNCMDCHGGDENYAHFQFEEIEEGYQNSVHYKLEEEGFSCWKCHDPHSYKINIRNTENLRETILYDNNICLHCHSDFERFRLLSDREESNIIEKHDWLPNQSSHFKSVRCIECHSSINNNILVSHDIRPKTEAVRLCNECHSQNSLLMASLYKFKSREQRSDGFFNGIILNESYVIGANRNEYLNLLSLIIFGVVLAIIGVHIIFRLRLKKTN
jgi:hypothetical protein